jgi:uncharacterized RDD family membrane protein YckC
MIGSATQAAADTTPSIIRRLACFVYEGVLLFGVLMIAGYLFSTLTQQRHALSGRFGLQAFLFRVLGIYFTWFWSHGGQTVAMKAWHLRLVKRDGTPVSELRAFARYLLSWMWFVPALLVLWLSGARDPSSAAVALFVGVIGFAALALLHPTRQFWHDAVCGTKLITSRPAPHTAA